jgi:signal transduction histidine kinase
MKLVKKRKDGSTEALKVADKEKQKSIKALPPWKLLIVDDEHDVHTMTKLSLKEFEFVGRPLQIYQAMSGQEAREILQQHSDIAVALVDIVMETDDAGLRLINYIRNELKYKMIRLIVRTGQPGMAPERQVIEEYDIDDYKSKTELRADKLFLTMRVTLKAYRDLQTLDTNRRALRKILEAVPKFNHAQSLTHFFNGVLTQLIGLCNLGENSLIYSINSGLVITTDPKQNEVVVQSGTGRFAPAQNQEEIDKIRHICLKRIVNKNTQQSIPENVLLIPLEIQNKQIGFVYLENATHLSEADLDLIHIMVQQCSSALENLQLYMDLKEANQKTLKMLELAEQARQDAENANQAKSQFLAKMSHELRTPLNAILGYSEMLEDSATEFNVEQEQCIADLHKIQEASYRLLKMINEVLDFSKLDTGQMPLKVTTFDLKPLIDDIITTMTPLIEESYNEFDLQLDNVLGEMQSDRGKIHQILLILLSNATKFTEKGKICLYAHYTTEQVTFKVIDNGIGMTEAQIKKLFFPFTQADDSTTRRYEGTGLGLTICHRLTEMLGGRLAVESEINQGSTFILSVPTVLESS